MGRSARWWTRWGRSLAVGLGVVTGILGPAAPGAAGEAVTSSLHVPLEGTHSLYNGLTLVDTITLAGEVHLVTKATPTGAGFDIRIHANLHQVYGMGNLGGYVLVGSARLEVQTPPDPFFVLDRVVDFDLVPLFPADPMWPTDPMVPVRLSLTFSADGTLTEALAAVHVHVP